MSRGGSIASSVFEFPRAAPSTARRPNKRVPAPSASQASPPARQRERTAGHPTGPGGPTSSDATEERTTREEGAEVYMAVVLAGRRLGVAVYDADAGTLQVMEMHDDDVTGFAGLQLFKYHTRPRAIYTPSTSDDAFLTVLGSSVFPTGEDPEDDLQRGDNRDGDDSAETSPAGVRDTEQAVYDVHLERSAIFAEDTARRRLLFLRVLEADDSHSGAPRMEWERIHFIHSMLNLEASEQVRAAGALMAIMQRDGLCTATTSIDHEGNSQTAIQVTSVSECGLKGMLMLDAQSYAALQVFHEERHPSAMGLGKAKEGLSMYGVLNQCVSAPGRALLRLWLARPLVDLSAIIARQDAVAFLMVNTDVTSSLQSSLKHSRDLRKVLRSLRMPSVRLNIKDWTHLHSTTQALLDLANVLFVALDGVGTTLQGPREALAGAEEHLLYVKGFINKVIDFEQECSYEAPTLIAFGVCEELDTLKSIYRTLPEFLSEVGRKEMDRVPDDLALAHPNLAASVEYIPQIGYLMRFEGGRLSAALARALPDYRFQFESSHRSSHAGEQVQGAYYSNDRMLELNHQFGDIWHKIMDFESAILHDLQTRVVAKAAALYRACAAAAELDCLVSLAAVAKLHNYCRPVLSDDDPQLHITNGRHPLMEAAMDVFVPNDTHCERTVGRINVITGPNYSGKSVYLKQVGLIVLLAHVGSFVPADAARVPLVDRIFTRLASPESFSRRVAQSAFMCELQQVASLLRHHTRRSLLLIDEFGKGTLAADGLALLCAVLSFVAASTAPPLALVSTHYSEVMDPQLLPPSDAVRCYTMSVIETSRGEHTTAGAHQTQVVFLYKLLPGAVAPSYGVHCARMVGVPQEAVLRALEVLELDATHMPIERRPAVTQDQDARYIAIANALLGFDAQHGDPRAFLQRLFEQQVAPPVMPPMNELHDAAAARASKVLREGDMADCRGSTIKSSHAHRGL